MVSDKCSCAKMLESDVWVEREPDKAVLRIVAHKPIPAGVSSNTHKSDGGVWYNTKQCLTVNEPGHNSDYGVVTSYAAETCAYPSCDLPSHTAGDSVRPRITAVQPLDVRSIRSTLAGAPSAAEVGLPLRRGGCRRRPDRRFLRVMIGNIIGGTGLRAPLPAQVEQGLWARPAAECQ